MPGRRGRSPGARARPGAATGRDLRHDLEQRHLRGLRRGDVLLGLLPRRGRLGHAADLGLRRGREQRGRGGRGRHAPLRISAVLLAPGRDAGRRRRVRVRRRLSAQSRPALRLPPLPGHRRRPLLPGRDRGDPDAAAAALLHLVPDRRPARRRRPGDARAGDRLQRLQQDLDRRRLPARPARGRRAGRAHLRAQRRVRRGAGDLRPHRLLRRDRLARARPGHLRRRLRRRRGPPGGPLPLRRRPRPQHGGRRDPLGGDGRRARASCRGRPRPSSSRPTASPSAPRTGAAPPSRPASPTPGTPSASGSTAGWRRSTARASMPCRTPGSTCSRGGSSRSRPTSSRSERPWPGAVSGGEPALLLGADRRRRQQAAEAAPDRLAAASRGRRQQRRQLPVLA